MATVYLHIGFPKTGTTALQIFLYKNRDVLEKLGVCFPDFGLRYKGIGFRKNARFLIAPYAVADKSKDYSRPAAEYEPTLDKIAELGRSHDKILLTDEGVWHFSTKREGFWPELKEDLAKRGMELKIIVYLRRQDSFIQSLYAQHIKNTKQPLTFREYLDSEHVQQWPLDLKEGMDRISSALGRENLIIRIYEKSQYQGPEHSLFSDFLDIFGLKISDGFSMKKENYHPSLEGTYLELKRLLNILPQNAKNCPSIQKSIETVQGINPYTQNRPKTAYFKPREAQAFLDQFAQSNCSLAREYLGREDGRLFYEPIQELPEESLTTEDLLRDTILIYGQAIQLLEKENNRLQKSFDNLEARLEKLRIQHETSVTTRVEKKIKRLIKRSN